MHRFSILFSGFFFLNSAKAEDLVDSFVYPVGMEGQLEGYRIDQFFGTAAAEGYCSVAPYNQTQANCTGTWRYGHDGIDINNTDGSDCGEPVYASAAGHVVHAAWTSGWGNQVRIRHLTSDGYRYTLYGHLQDIGVLDDQEVTQGQQIGTIGNGGVSTGCHLHFGVLNEDISGAGYYYASMPSTHIDPIYFIAAMAIQAKADELWGIQPYGGSDCEDGLICEESSGGNIHWYANVEDPFLIENWYNGIWGEISLTYDPGTNQTTHAYVLRHGFQEYYLNSGGPNLFGPPLGDEMDQTQVSTYTPYDPYCTGQQGYTEPEACIEEFCGSSRTYTSVQRFEHTTLCWDPSVGVVCDPQNANREVCDQAESTWSASSSSYGGVSTSEGNLWVHNSTIHWVHNGSTHGIVSSEMFEACGFSWSEPYPVSEDTFNELPSGSLLDDPTDCGAVQDGTLVDQGGTVYEYWESDASWHGYPSTLVFDACLNDWNQVETMTSSVFNTITIGSVVGNSVDCGVLNPGNLVHWNGTVYRITENSLKRGFTSAEVFNACAYDWDLVTYLANEDYPVVTTLQDGSAISSTSDCSNIQGDLVHWEWTGTIYYLTGTGYKRGVTSTQAMTSCGFDWNQVRYVTNANGAVVWTLGDAANITGNGDCP